MTVLGEERGIDCRGRCGGLAMGIMVKNSCWKIS